MLLDQQTNPFTLSHHHRKHLVDVVLVLAVAVSVVILILQSTSTSIFSSSSQSTETETDWKVTEDEVNGERWRNRYLSHLSPSTSSSV